MRQQNKYKKAIICVVSSLKKQTATWNRQHPRFFLLVVSAAWLKMTKTVKKISCKRCHISHQFKSCFGFQVRKSFKKICKKTTSYHMNLGKNWKTREGSAFSQKVTFALASTSWRATSRCPSLHAIHRGERPLLLLASMLALALSNARTDSWNGSHEILHLRRISIKRPLSWWAFHDLKEPGGNLMQFFSDAKNPTQNHTWLFFCCRWFTFSLFAPQKNHPGV